MHGSSAAELADNIERQLVDSVLRPGDRLPPVRVLATDLGLASNTVAAAYRRLGERGIAVGRGRSGTFIVDRPPIMVPAEPEIPEGLCDLATGNPDPGLLPDIGSLIGEPGGPHTLYGARSIDEGLAEHGARSLAADGIPADHIAVVSGALDGIERILQAHLRRGDSVAVEDPTYGPVIDLIGALGLVAVPVAIDDNGPRPSSLSDALDKGVAALIITPRAQNPFGSAISPDRASALRSILEDHPQALLIEDDHAAAVAGAAMQWLGGDRQHWATVRSAAKTYGPDLRLALMAGDATTIQRVEGRQRLGPGWVSHMLQRLVARMMNDPEVTRLIARAAERYASQREAVFEALKERSVAAHAASGLNVWVPVHDEATTVKMMERRGFAIRSGGRFRIVSRPGVRVTVAAIDATEVHLVADALHESVSYPGAGTRTG